MIKEQKIEGVGLLKGAIKLAKEVMMEKPISDREVKTDKSTITTKLTEAEKVLVKMIPLSTPKELPKDFIENCQHIWEAFNVGREYERLLEKEVRDANRSV